MHTRNFSFTLLERSKSPMRSRVSMHLCSLVLWRLALCYLVFAATSVLAAAQTNVSNPVPNLINYNGVLKDSAGKIITSTAGVTFLIYKDEQGGSPLWQETQTVIPDSAGNYTVQLGTTNTGGLPASIFQNGQARWLAVQTSGEPEQSRVLFVAVPYAMKAQDASTVGGLPPSAFVLAGTSGASNGSSASPIVSAKSAATSGGRKVPPPGTFTVTTNGGTSGNIPMFTGVSDIENSVITQSGNNIGVGTTTPTVPFQVQGANTTGTGIQNITVNTTTSTNSFAVIAAESRASGGVTSELVADGYGTGPLKLPSGYIGNYTNQPFGFITGNTERMRITTTGSIGIGTTVPAATLDVNGTGNFSGALSAQSLYVSDSLPYPLFATTSYSTGVGVLGITTSQTTSPNSYGVYGQANGPNGNAIGVYGKALNTFGMGTFGQTGTLSSVGGFHIGLQGAGLWGDGGPGAVYGTSAGVIGTIDDGNAAYFENNSASGWPTVLILEDNEANTGNLLEAYGWGYHHCYIAATGDLSCTGTKNAIVPLDGGKRTVALSAIESPVNWFEDAGSARLVNGRAIVSLDPDFIQTVNTTRDYKVFPVPTGDCKGLYVINKTASSFEVHELGGGTSDVTFDYRIMALRLNYENVRFDDRTEQVGRMQRNRERLVAKKQSPNSAAH